MMEDSKDSKDSKDSQEVKEVKEVKEADSFFGKFEPLIEKLIEVYVFLSPTIDILRKNGVIVWRKVEPYYRSYFSPEYLEIFLGMVLLFFGGQYAMTVACFTAIRISGWDLIKQSMQKIRYNYNQAMDAFEKDPSSKKYFDTDNDGKISAKEIKEAATKIFKGTKDEKMAVLSHLRCVFIAIDPSEVMNALIGIWNVLITVIATLRSQFAKDIALGVSLGQYITKSIERYIKPYIVKNVDDELKKWVDFMITTVCKIIGISLALLLARMVSALQSAIKGGHLLSLHIFKFLMNKQLMPKSINAPNMDFESDIMFIAIQYMLAMYGFYWQISSGFVIHSIILRFILLPFTFIETILTFFAAY